VANDDFDEGKTGMGVEYLKSIDYPMTSDSVFHPHGQKPVVQSIKSPLQRGRLQYMRAH